MRHEGCKPAGDRFENLVARTATFSTYAIEVAGLQDVQNVQNGTAFFQSSKHGFTCSKVLAAAEARPGG